MSETILDKIKRHHQRRNQSLDIISRAPGRINLIGEHTDYNGGLAFPAAIDKYLYFGFTSNQTNTIRITALDIDESVEITIGKYKRTGMLWADYLIGILNEFQKNGAIVSGFDCSFSSDIPIGSGLSSSAALDCAFILGVNALSQSDLDKWEMVNMSNRSNNTFLGIQSGILDQFASVFGRENHAMVLDTDAQKYTHVPFDIKDYSWLLMNTNVKHDHTTSGYNDRVNECKSALYSIQKSYPEVKHLSDFQDFAIINTTSFESDIIRNRAEFIFEENLRVNQFHDALQANDLERCGQLLYDSHQGLQTKYEVSSEELDFLVDLLRPNPNVLGSRMMGGGFGGCTLNLVHNSAINDILKDVEEKYFNQFGIHSESYIVNVSEGASIL